MNRANQALPVEYHGPVGEVGDWGSAPVSAMEYLYRVRQEAETIPDVSVRPSSSCGCETQRARNRRVPATVRAAHGRRVNVRRQGGDGQKARLFACHFPPSTIHVSIALSHTWIPSSGTPHHPRPSSRRLHHGLIHDRSPISWHSCGTRKQCLQAVKRARSGRCV